MKCPWRKRVIHYRNEKDGCGVPIPEQEVEQWEPCIKEECPFYKGKFQAKPGCGRAEKREE
ncbi:hypothetical protein M0R36_11260 [bacterium]|jgi:hypothetical protein|nr:hypothetical protein [bacterium]